MNSKKIAKPLSAYQHYLKDWKNLPEEAKKSYINLANEDLKRYKEKVEEKAVEADIKKLQIYLSAYAGGCSVEDNVSNCFNTIGPVTKIIEYSEEEQKKWGVRVKEFQYYDDNTKMNTSLYHNEKYYIAFYKAYGQGINVYTHGKTYNYKKDNVYSPCPRKYRVNETAKKAGTYTDHSTSFDNTTLTKMTINF